MQRLLRFPSLRGAEATDPHSGSDTHTPSPAVCRVQSGRCVPTPPHLDLVFLFISCQTWTQIRHFKLHNSVEPASVLYDQSVRQAARLVGRDDRAALQSVTHTTIQ